MSNSYATAQANQIMMHDLLVSHLGRELVDHIAQINTMDDPMTFDLLVSVQRKSDSGRVVLRVPNGDYRGYDGYPLIKLSDANKALLVLFLHE